MLILKRVPSNRREISTLKHLLIGHIRCKLDILCKFGNSRERGGGGGGFLAKNTPPPPPPPPTPWEHLVALIEKVCTGCLVRTWCVPLLINHKQVTTCVQSDGSWAIFQQTPYTLFTYAGAPRSKQISTRSSSKFILNCASPSGIQVASSAPCSSVSIYKWANVKVR
jgi:hypothetical protein